MMTDHPDVGDFVDSDNEEEVDDLEENAEPLIMHFQGPIYYPICIGNIAQRYRVEHKLGHGGFMWSYVCLFAELYLGTLPWSIYGHALSGVVQVLGPLPQMWRGCYHQPPQAQASWYDQRKQPEFTLESLIAHAHPDASLVERAHVLSFLRNGFSYVPRNRLTSTQLLNDASFQAVMGIYGV